MTFIHRLGKLIAVAIAVTCCGMQSCRLDHGDQEYLDRCRQDLQLILLFVNEIDELHPLGDHWQTVVDTEFTANDLFGRLGVEYHGSVQDLRGRPYRILIHNNDSRAWAEGLDGRNNHGAGDDVVVPFELQSGKGWERARKGNEHSGKQSGKTN